MKRLERLTDALRHEQDAQLDAIDVSRTRELLLKKRPRPVRKLPLLVAAAAMVVVALAWWGRAAPPVTFTVAGVVGQPGAWVAARAEPLDVAFSDGSRFVLQPDSRVRVDETTAHGARVIVERGGLDADVQHLEDAAWAVRLGPYEVHVIGTRFTATWNASDERLRVVLHEGSVEVVGPHLGDGIRMVPGQRLEVSQGSGEVVLRSLDGRAATTAAPIPSQIPSSRPSASVPGTAVVVPVPPRAATTATASTSSGAPDWRALAAERRYKDAMVAAKAHGIGRLMAELDAGSLLQLADVSRFAGDGPTAIALLQTVRSRFAGSTSAARAAFLLGTLSPSGPAAAQWFTTYVAEAPSGALVREARGRIIEAHVAGGSTAAARAAATAYLQSYPQGPHAALARRTLGLAESP